jgi:hypothetical protein
MADTDPTPQPPQQRHVETYEDPHYHDDDELPASDDEGRPKPARPPGRRKVPLPRRRRYEDD